MTPRRRIKTIDCDYLHPEFAAAYLLIDQPHGQPAANARAAFIDNNTAHSVPLLLKALKQEGLTPEQVDLVIITHVHLDHAGGTSLLMQACPEAMALAHPRAVKHLIDPSKLIKSARHVYGDEPFDRMYGRIDPILAARVRAIEDGELIPFAQRSEFPLKFMHTRGHANHHMCIIEPETNSIFTGDAFGLAYPALQRHGLFIFPSTSPTDFDYDEAVLSIEKIVATGSSRAYPTHFGAVKDLPGAARQLLDHLAFSRDLISRAMASKDSSETLVASFTQELTRRLMESANAGGLELSTSDLALLHLDIELNAQGLVHVVNKKREAA